MEEWETQYEGMGDTYEHSCLVKNIYRFHPHPGIHYIAGIWCYWQASRYSTYCD